MRREVPGNAPEPVPGPVPGPEPEPVCLPLDVSGSTLSVPGSGSCGPVPPDSSTGAGGRMLVVGDGDASTLVSCGAGGATGRMN